MHKISNDEFSGHCKICEDICVSNRGKDSLVRHSRKASHVKLAMKFRDSSETRQLTMIKSTAPAQLTLLESFSKVQACESTKEMSFPDKVTAAEMFWCTSLAVYHLSVLTSDKLSQSLSICFRTPKLHLK